MTIAQTLLQILARRLDTIRSNVATYNHRFRDVALSYLSAERPEVTFGKSGRL